ncbi:hypothetical protein [Tropicibacter sp. S64]|uniref:hypothetical protein n=1 Tax=Tropicibacter sp. S64 TaxID=3415122 RepID=UPI003C7D53BA
MGRLKLAGAPQLSRILKEAPSDQIQGFMNSKQVSGILDGTSFSEAEGPDTIHVRLSSLPKDDLSVIEKQAVRIVQVAGQRADALQLRFAESHKFDCLEELSDQPGPLLRALWTYHARHELFVATERAMQVRSFRENDRAFHTFVVHSPRPLELETLDENHFASDIAARLDLRHGCVAEAVELPPREASPRQIMIAVTAAGPRESSRTFEPDQSIGTIQYRPANELILVYFPDDGRIELCGRRWSDRKIVAESFAREILGEDLSNRPLRQRRYDLSMFRRALNFEPPEDLQDRIRSVEVTELRVALGSYDRKVTLTVAPGEDIERLRRDIFGSIRNRHGKGFVCDVELYLRVNLSGSAERSLRFKISNSNSNSCTLQSQTDPDLRAVGFELLEAWGVVKSFRDASLGELSDLLPILIALLDHSSDDISGPELVQMHSDVDQLTSTRYLGRCQIVETLIIEDDELGDVLADVLPDFRAKSAGLSVFGEQLEQTVDLNEVSRWRINRDYIIETLTDALSDLGISKVPKSLNDNVFFLGHITLGDRSHPVFLATRLAEDKAFKSADDVIRAAADLAAGFVLVPGTEPLNHLGSHVVVSLENIIRDRERHHSALEDAWRLNRMGARAASLVSFKIFGQTKAELILPERPVWTIIGEKQIRIIERLYQAHCSGEQVVKTGELLKYSGAAQLGSTFGVEWKSRIVGTYLENPKPSFWKLAVQPPS